MRLAVFTDSFYPELGGIQDSILTIVRALGERGHAIRVYAPAAPARDFARAGVVPPAEPDAGPNVEIRRLPSLPLPSSSQQSRLLLPTGRPERELADFAPDLVHLHTFFGAGAAARRAARGLRLPLLGTNHWYPQGFALYAPFARAALRRFGARAVARYYQACDWVTAPSRFTLDDMREHGLSREGSVISNPIDTRVFRPVSAAEKGSLKARLGLGADTVVYAGRLAREKRIEVLLEAVAIARRSRPGIELVLAGHGSARAGLERRARGLGIADRVRFMGTLSHAALAELFAASEVFAIASLSETQSMVLLQAMACGLPAVGARCGGLIEHIPPETGFLAEPDDAADFAAKLLHALADPWRATRAVAARRAAERHSIPAIAAAWEGLYAQLAGSGGVPIPSTAPPRS
ncbi:MAG TPA: glycosyltransferase [Gammaproteobacteria bacterium]|nr:glycosyltransferase [Gammaproteobacteria bacterium]